MGIAPLQKPAPPANGQSPNATRSCLQANASVDWGKLPQRPISPQRQRPPEEARGARGAAFNYNQAVVRAAVEPHVSFGASGYAATYA